MTALFSTFHVPMPVLRSGEPSMHCCSHAFTSALKTLPAFPMGMGAAANTRAAGPASITRALPRARLLRTWGGKGSSIPQRGAAYPLSSFLRAPSPLVSPGTPVPFGNKRH